jgi:hypothetical protein
MNEPKTIGDRSRDGLLEIVDTNWDFNGTLRVTVRETIGGRGGPHDCGWVGGLPIRRMRTLARSALMHPEKTRSCREVNRFYDEGTWKVTFAVSRLEVQ